MSVFQLDPKTFHNVWHILPICLFPLSFHTYFFYIHKCIYFPYIPLRFASVHIYIYIYSPINFHTVYYIPIYFTIENRYTHTHIYIYTHTHVDIWIMVSKGNVPQITLFQVSELLSFTRIFPTGIAADIAADSLGLRREPRVGRQLRKGLGQGWHGKNMFF